MRDDVRAVVVTRGDVGLIDVLAPYDELGIPTYVWDNSARENLAVYGRYAAIEYVDEPVILVQDDDCILTVAAIEALLAAYEPGKVVCNMPERFRPHYPDSALVGFGAIFDRNLPAQAFRRFRRTDDMQAFHRECDTVFTGLTPRVLVDVEYTDREFASDPDRLWKQPNHHAERQRMLHLVRRVRRDQVLA